MLDLGWQATGVVVIAGQGRCEVIAQGKRCASQYRIEIDHVTPIAQMGVIANELTFV